MTLPPIEELAQFTPEALGELKSWLEPWFLTRNGAPGIKQITSRDKTVAIKHPSGPIVDLSASGGGIEEITASLGDFIIGNPFGPITDLIIANNTYSIVAVGWQASATPGDEVTAKTSLVYGPGHFGITLFTTVTVIFQAQGGTGITFRAENFDPTSIPRTLANIAGAFQDLASNTRQTFSNSPGVTLPSLTPVDIPFDDSGVVGALVDTTTTPATWIADGRYALTLTFVG